LLALHGLMWTIIHIGGKMENSKENSKDGVELKDAETFLGGLRSELDEGSHLHSSFASLAAVADTVRANFLSYSISPEKTAEIFVALRLIDDNDIEWTVGPSSGSWYRRRVDTKGWQPGPPPLMAVPRTDQELPWLGKEFSDLIPAARSRPSNETGGNTGNQASIRVVNIESHVEENFKEDTDWLLTEWNLLESEISQLENNSKTSEHSANPIDSINAAWPIQAALNRISIEQNIAREDTSSEVRIGDNGLPAFIKGSEDVDVFDMFIRPDMPIDRDGSVTESDITGSAPSERIAEENIVEAEIPISIIANVEVDANSTQSPDSFIPFDVFEGSEDSSNSNVYLSPSHTSLTSALDSTDTKEPTANQLDDDNKPA